jgi:hypothetical protein
VRILIATDVASDGRRARGDHRRGDSVRDVERFDGAVAGIGTASGARLVVGMWPGSPDGSVTDVMIERADGHRILLAPSRHRVDVIAGSDAVDEVRIAPVLRVRDGKKWMVSTGGLALTFHVGRRPVLGWLLAVVPRRLARARWWTSVLDPIARLTMGGVRTRGTTRGRREWFSPLDLHRIRSVSARLDGVELGELRPVTPPVRFGIGRPPRAPSLVRLAWTVCPR